VGERISQRPDPAFFRVQTIVYLSKPLYIAASTGVQTFNVQPPRQPQHSLANMSLIDRAEGAPGENLEVTRFSAGWAVLRLGKYTAGSSHSLPPSSGSVWRPPSIPVPYHSVLL